MEWWSVALRKNTMPPSFLSENLKPMISVQNFVLRSMSLTLRTTWPIFLILIGDVSVAIGCSFRFLVAPGMSQPEVGNYYHGITGKAKLNGANAGETCPPACGRTRAANADPTSAV